MRTSRVAGMHGEGRAAAQVSETLLQFRHERDDRELYRNRENTQGKGSFTLAVSANKMAKLPNGIRALVQYEHLHNSTQAIFYRFRPVSTLP